MPTPGEAHPTSHPAASPGGGRCAHCGYSLTGLPEGGRCPECGVATPSASPTPGGVFCVRCGYDLVGLPGRGVCPECGAPVAFSLRGHLLSFAAPRYLRALSQGLTLVACGFACLGLFIALYVMAHGSSTAGQAVEVLLEALYAVAVLLILLGYVRYAKPDPGYAGREDPVTARRVLSWSSVVMLALAVAAVVMRSFGLPTGLLTLRDLTAPASTHFPGAVVMACLLATIGVQYFAVLRYTAWLGRRIPDGHVVDRARRYRWVLPLLPVWGLAPIIAVVLPGAGRVVSPYFGCCAVCTLPIALLIAVCLYLSLLSRVHAHVRAIRATGSPAHFPEMTPASEMTW